MTSRLAFVEVPSTTLTPLPRFSCRRMNAGFRHASFSPSLESIVARGVADHTLVEIDSVTVRLVWKKRDCHIGLRRAVLISPRVEPVVEDVDVAQLNGFHISLLKPWGNNDDIISGGSISQRERARGRDGLRLHIQCGRDGTLQPNLHPSNVGSGTARPVFNNDAPRNVGNRRDHDACVGNTAERFFEVPLLLY